MSIQQIIDDLKEMGTDEAAMKIHFMRLGFSQPKSFFPDAVTLAGLFDWSSTPESHKYWQNLNEKLREFRKARTKS